MSQIETTAVVLRESRFVTDLGVVRLLLPGIDAACPRLSVIEYVDGIPRSAVGWPIQPSEALRRELFRFVVTAVGRALHESDGRDLDDLTLNGVREEPYFRELTDLLARCLAHGPHLRLDSVLWLYVSTQVARLLTRDDALLREFATTFPDDVAKATQYLDELLRLKGANPARHATVKGRALRALLARHDIALGCLDDPAAESGIHRLLVDCRLSWTEQPNGLYSFFDLREAFLTRDRALPLEQFLALQTFVRAAIDDAWRKRSAGNTTLAERWLLQEFISESLLERASRLDLAGLADSQEDDYPAKVAVIGSLQPRLASYVLHHADQFQPSRAAAKRYDMGRDQLKQVKDAEAVARSAGHYVDVVEDVLRWDVLNTLRGLLHPVTREASGWVEGARRLRSSAAVLDLAHPGTVFSRRRHGTVLAWRLVGFEPALRRRAEVEGLDLPSGDDFAALCLRRILAARELLPSSGGRPDGFDRGIGRDVFPRALDALRYALALRGALDAEQHVQVGLVHPPAPNPFARAIRLGMAAGDYIDVQIPSELGSPQPRAIGDGPDGAVSLVEQPDGPDLAGRIAVDEYDPLEVFRATVTAGALVNAGFVSNERAFREVLASVRLDGMTHAAQDRDAVIAGRAVDFKNYSFELVFDDPVSRRIVLVRRVSEPAIISGLEVPVFEYIDMDVEQFVSFHDRAADAARHQPVVRRSAPSARAPNPPADRAAPRAQPKRPVRSSRGAGRSSRSPAAASVPDLAIPDAGAFLVGTGSSSNDVLGGKLGLSFEDGPPTDDSGGFLSGLFGRSEDSGAAWPPSEGWLSESSDNVGALPAGPGLQEDFTALVGDPPTPAPDASFADSAFDDFSLGDPRPAARTPAAVGALFDFSSESGADPSFPEPESTESSSTSGAWPTAEGSLLGALDAGFLGRLADAAPDVAPQVASREARRKKSTPAAPRPEPVRVARPDFSALFRDYVVFDIRALGEVAIGRRYKDVLFDLHRFPRSTGSEAARQKVLDEFMRLKVRDNFVPRSLSYDEVPEGAGTLHPLTIDSLEQAFDRVT